MESPRLNKWLSWFQVIQGEVQGLLIAKDIFWSVQDLIRVNPDIQKPSAFYDYLGYTYASHVLVGIRRQVKIDKQSISLARLFAEIISSPEHLSRAYFTALYEGSVVKMWANRDFDRFCEAEGRNHISPEMVSRDLERLRTVASNCERFADKQIAHRDQANSVAVPTFNEVGDVVKTLDELCAKYYLIFKAGSMDSLMPVYQYDWQEIFDHPWRKQ